MTQQNKPNISTRISQAKDKAYNLQYRLGKLDDAIFGPQIKASTISAATITSAQINVGNGVDQEVDKLQDELRKVEELVAKLEKAFITQGEYANINVDALHPDAITIAQI